MIKKAMLLVFHSLIFNIKICAKLSNLCYPCSTSFEHWFLIIIKYLSFHLRFFTKI